MIDVGSIIKFSDNVLPDALDIALTRGKHAEHFAEFMDQLIKYLENPSPIEAQWLRALQQKYHIRITIRDAAPYKLGMHVMIVYRQVRDWWDEFVPYDVADTIMKAVHYD